MVKSQDTSTTDVRPAGTAHDRIVEVIVKVSKLCNLRCRYCYEMPFLSNPEAMSREQLAAMYRNLGEYFSAVDERDGLVTQVQFVWHGGEPLMQPTRLYWDTFADQAEIFEGRPLVNSVQTNLVRLDQERLELLVDGFDGVGVSLDVSGGLRVNVAGRDSQQQVVRNLQQLLQERHGVGAITVLNARNIHAVDEIFRYYEDLGIGFRVLPLFDTADLEQTGPMELSQQQQLYAMERLFDLWLESQNTPMPPLPLNDYARLAVRHLLGIQIPACTDMQEWLPYLLVDTDGQCYTFGEPYGDPEWSLGNIFNTSLQSMLDSDTFRRCADNSDRRIAMACLTCPFFAGCGGAFVAWTHPSHRDTDESGAMSCMARPVISHIVDRLQQTMPDTLREIALPTPGTTLDPSAAGRR